MRPPLRKHSIHRILILYIMIIGTIFFSFPLSLQISALDTEWDFTPTITKNVYYNQSLSYNQNITITTGASLSLYNLTFDVEEPLLIYVESGASLLLENCTFLGGLDNTVKIAIKADLGSSLTIRNCRFYNLGKVGENDYLFDHSSIWSMASSTQIINSQFFNLEDQNTYITLFNISANALIYNNTFYSPLYSYDSNSITIFNSNPLSSSTTPIILSGNLFKESPGIYIEQSSNITISNNVMTHNEDVWGRIAIYIQNAENITLTGNYLEGWDTIVWGMFSTNLLFENNIFRGPLTHIRTSSCDSLVLQNNTFVKPSLQSDSLIDLDGTHIRLIGNNISVYSPNMFSNAREFCVPLRFNKYLLGENDLFLPLGTGDGIPNYFNGKKIVYYYNLSNSVKDFQGTDYGLIIINEAINSTIQNLNMENAGGLYFLSDIINTTLQNISIRNSSIHGIYIEDGVKSSQLTDIEIDRVHGYGIFGSYMEECVLSNLSVANSDVGFFSYDVYDVTFTSCQFQYNGLLYYKNAEEGKDPETDIIYAGLIIQGTASNFTLIDSLFLKNWYYGVLLGGEEGRSHTDIIVRNCNFSQFVDPLLRLYSVSVVDNGNNASQSRWENNMYSEVQDENTPYAIPGSSGAIDEQPLFIDSDNDGASDAAEWAWNSDYLTTGDTDNDFLSDYDEIFSYKTSPSHNDTDGDSLSDYEEVFVTLTDPLSLDTDKDGFSDYYEFLYGTDGNDAQSYPGNNTVSYSNEEPAEEQPPSLMKTIAGYPSRSMSISFIFSLFALIFSTKKKILKVSLSIKHDK